MMQARGCDMPGGRRLRGARRTTTGSTATLLSANGTYRTLCVRTCDGYYFPISFSTTPDRFARGCADLRGHVPGRRGGALLLSQIPGGGPENMVSITGEPYSSLPTAFQYRTSLDPCLHLQAGRRLSPPPFALVGASPRRSRGRAASTPETRADRARRCRAPARAGRRPGDARRPRRLFRAGAASGESSSAGTPVATRPTSGRPIRVVGPALGNAAQDALVISPVPN